MLDRRVPSGPWSTPERWETAVRSLGRQDPQPSLAQIRAALVGEFGPEASLCDNTLRRILAKAGLWIPRLRGGVPVEEVIEVSGGGALVPLLAASLESGAVQEMAKAIAELAQVQQPPATAPPPEPEGRDEKTGCFTAVFNQNRLRLLAETGASFYRPAVEARKDKDLTRLRLAHLEVATLEQHLRCLMVAPLLMRGRGMAGIDGPAGGWLEVFSPVAYKAATLDTTLSELKLLGAAETMW
jgi:hypothetical protein